MSYDASAAAPFSGRPNYDLYVYVRRGSTDVANRRATYAFQVIARRRSGAISFDLTGRTVYMNIGGHYQESYGNVLDFRSTDNIIVGGGETGWITHDANGYLSLAFSAVMVGAGLFGDANPAGTLVADRIPVKPSAPGTPTASSITSTSMALSWTAPSNGGSAITNYYLDRATNSAFTTGLTTVTLGNVTSYTAAGLNPATTYYWRVSAKNGVGTGPESGTRTQATAVAVPTVPLSVAATNPTPTGATMSWVAPANNGGGAIARYIVQRALTPTMTTGLTEYTVTVPGLSLVFTDMAPSTTYYLRVAAENSAGRGPWSDPIPITTASGAYVSNGTIWQPAGVYVSDGTVWKVAEVQVSNGTAWIAAV